MMKFLYTLILVALVAMPAMAWDTQGPWTLATASMDIDWGTVYYTADFAERAYPVGVMLKGDGPFTYDIADMAGNHFTTTVNVDTILDYTTLARFKVKYPCFETYMGVVDSLFTTTSDTVFYSLLYDLEKR